MISVKTRLEKKLEAENLYSTPEEQLRQVMAWYPNKKLHRRPSSKSGKQIISVYSADVDCPVYQHEEWYADDWDIQGLDYSVDTPFFAQFAELQKKAPVVALLSHLQENSEYCQDCEGLKDCYLVFDAINCRDVYYAVRTYETNDCVDIYWVLNSELLYDCTYMFSCYNTKYSFCCKQASDSAFLFNCRNVTHCFMCSNLRNKSYCIRNTQYSKREYQAYLATLDLTDYHSVLRLKKEFDELLNSTIRPGAILENTEAVSGNYLRNSAHCELAFESFDLRDCYNVFQCGAGKDIYGSFMCNDRIERCFQSVATGIDSFETRNCAFVWHSSEMEYCYLCINCKNCFGCIGLRNKEYHIFNIPYSREEYQQRKEELVAAMLRRGEYGYFFPIDLSPFPYEDTIAHEFFDAGAVHTLEIELARAAQLDTRSEDVKPVVSCAVTGEPFRHTEQELRFYKKHDIPPPRLSFAARYRRRIETMDTSFQPRRTQNAQICYFKHPEKLHIVEESEYLDSLR